MMDYKETALTFATLRENAKLLPNRFKKVNTFQSFSSLEISVLASLLFALLTFAGVFGYILVSYGDNFNLIVNGAASVKFLKLDFLESFKWFVLAFILFFPLPTLVSLLIPNHKQDAQHRLTNPKHFLLHGSLSVWMIVLFNLIVGSFLPDSFIEWNSLLSSTKFFMMVGIAWTAYETLLAFNLYQEKRSLTIENQQTKSDFKLWLGKSTGLLATRQHGAGILRNQPIVLDLEDAAKNIIIFGGIGSGKTTCAITPLLLQLLDQGCGGLIFDIKGDFQTLVMRLAKSLGKGKRIVRLGIDGIPINLIDGILPEMATSFLKSAFLSDSRSSHSASAFWTDQATNLCTAVLGLLVHLPERYNLKDMYDYIFNPEAKTIIQSELKVIKPALGIKEMQLWVHYQDVIEREFESFNEKTRNDIRATITQVLMPFRNPRMTDAFCTPSHLNLENVMDGTVYLLNLPLGTHGIAARVAYTFIKLRFFNLMQNRVSTPAWNQSNAVFFMCDEYQDIVTGNTGGLSDLNLWDKSRSSKTIGIIAAQSMSSFRAAIGDSHISDAVLQNFRQKICFSTEDESTFDYFTRVTGTVEVKKRTLSRQHGSSSRGEGGTQSSNSRTETISYVKEQVIDAQLMRNLKPQQAIAIMTLQNHSCDDVLNMQAVR